MLINQSLMQTFTKRDKLLYARVIQLLSVLGDYAHKQSKERKLPTHRCHSICRAVRANIRQLRVVDGFYCGLKKVTISKMRWKIEPIWNDHSWLVTPDGAIIDPYPVGLIACNPVLVVASGTYAPFGSGLYVADRRVSLVAATPEMRKETRENTRLIRESQIAAQKTG